ncbi:MAG: flagellar transcriptional regulator FlhC [Rhodospirillaceae bacterium]
MSNTGRRDKSILSQARQIQLATELIELGARLQLLEAETDLSRERLLKLYKEIKRVSPPKGMLPFSTDWFLSWQPNIHSSLFAEIYRFLVGNAEVRGVAAIVKAYRLYLEHLSINGLEPVLSITRAWTLVRFLDKRILDTAHCKRCSGRFVVHALDLHKEYVCGLCNVPSRAGKGRKADGRRVLAASDPVPA